MKLLLLSFVTTATVVIVTARTKCTHDSQCGQNECCYYHVGPLIMSRKREANILPISLTDMHQGGWCETYRRQGAHCSVFEEMNGHCGCAPNLKCQFEPDPTAHLLLPGGIRRGLVYQGPGSYKCLPSQ